jgi:2-keto-4-pentenoate hydratase/2-oxohepta-3-ene-1,7-dioic acid hydratase in catechol pathway
MKICLFDSNRIGLIAGQEVIDVTEAFDSVPKPGWPYPKYDWLIRHCAELRPSIEQVAQRGQRFPLSSVRLQSPVANPGKIIGAPINYRDHIAEANADAEINHGKTYTDLDKFGLFIKANSSLIGCSEQIRFPFPDRRIDPEVELAVVIGREARQVSREQALDYVFGYCIGLDMTVRGPEFPSFRKSPDTFSVVGPWIVTADEIPDPNALDLSISVNGVLRQKSNTSFLIFDVQRLIEYASAMFTLYPGDIIMTGTPAGVGPVTFGDALDAFIAEVGTMSVQVAAQEGA